MTDRTTDTEIGRRDFARMTLGTLGAAALSADAGTKSMYASAAAEELLAERATALQRMRDAGVVVLDVAPDAMAAAVVSEYLELKARGAL